MENEIKANIQYIAQLLGYEDREIDYYEIEENENDEIQKDTLKIKFID